MRDIIEWLKPGARVKRYIFTLLISVVLLIFCGISLGGTSDLTPTMLSTSFTSFAIVAG